MLRVEAAEAANGPLPVSGFIHLEGIERLAFQEQARWLGTLKSREPPLGAEPGEAPRRRVVASTAADLEGLVREGAFDARLAFVFARDVIDVPALRDHIDDLRELVPALVRRLARLGGLHDARVPAPVVTALRGHLWPGNLDQLVRVLQHAVKQARGGVIQLEDVESALCDPESGAHSLRGERQQRQRDEILRLFDDCQGNLAEMARRLGVSRGSVVYRLQKLEPQLHPGLA
jgi:transcriptional regulator of acetoin/glycerol metabolism